MIYEVKAQKSIRSEHRTAEVVLTVSADSQTEAARKFELAFHTPQPNCRILKIDYMSLQETDQYDNQPDEELDGNIQEQDFAQAVATIG